MGLWRFCDGGFDVFFGLAEGERRFSRGGGESDCPIDRDDPSRKSGRRGSSRSESTSWGIEEKRVGSRRGNFRRGCRSKYHRRHPQRGGGLSISGGLHRRGTQRNRGRGFERSDQDLRHSFSHCFSSSRSSSYFAKNPCRGGSFIPQ